MKQQKQIKCPIGYGGVETTELDKYLADGWTVKYQTIDNMNYCVTFAIEKED